MYTRRYFYIALVLPLIITIFVVGYARLVLFVPVRDVGAMLVPYSSFCLSLILLASKQAPQAIRKLAYRAPLVFLIFQLAYLLLEYSSGVSVAADLSGLTGILVVVSTYVMIFGYLYLLLMEQGYVWYLYHKRQRGILQNKLS